MTTGETIQKYRKDCGMSQEELGQKLLVSRQTISLWEKDQTMPTIDNLIRLREVFGVSVDEMLGFENQTDDTEISPKEEYRFNYPTEELNEMYRTQRDSIYKRPTILTLVLIIILILCIGSSAQGAPAGFVFGVFFVWIIAFVKGILAYKKSWQKSIDLISKSTSEYKVYDDYIRLTIYRMGEKVSEAKYCFAELEKIHDYGKWFFLQFGGKLYVVRKSDLKESSSFYSYMNKNPTKAANPTPMKWWISSIILFVASIASLWGAVLLMAAVSNANGMSNENMWVFFLFTPVTVASVVLGFVMKKKGYKYKKNIIAGIIMTVLLCLYGCFAFIF